MADDKEYEIVEVDETLPLRRQHHMVVCVKNNILVFGGCNASGRLFSCHVIWMFNMFTEQWSKHLIPESKTAPHHISGACAVAIVDDVYVFGGFDRASWAPTNALWTLKRTFETSYVWSEIPTVDNGKAPSPRQCHRGWEYAGNLWVFGGHSSSPIGYLNENGKYCHMWDNHGFNNQLLSFDPSNQEWTNPKSFGAIPNPRENYAATKVKHNVWLYGGCGGSVVFGDLYKLNMSSLIWTQIETGNPKPKRRFSCTLTKTSETKLVLHGGYNNATWGGVFNDTWIFDISSQTWRQYKSNYDHACDYHTSTMGVNGCAVIICSAEHLKDSYHDYTISLLIMFEPRSLQQLATQKILEHRVELPWQHLPNKLIALLGISESDERTIEEPPISTS